MWTHSLFISLMARARAEPPIRNHQLEQPDEAGAVEWILADSACTFRFEKIKEIWRKSSKRRREGKKKRTQDKSKILIVILFNLPDTVLSLLVVEDILFSGSQDSCVRVWDISKVSDCKCTYSCFFIPFHSNHVCMSSKDIREVF